MALQLCINIMIGIMSQKYLFARLDFINSFINIKKLFIIVASQGIYYHKLNSFASITSCAEWGFLMDNVIANADNKDKPLARLLVVDDDRDTILALKIGLLDFGFLVDAFTNPQEALQSFKSNAESYCLVLLDIKCQHYLKSNSQEKSKRLIQM